MIEPKAHKQPGRRLSSARKALLARWQWCQTVSHHKTG